MLQVRGRAPEDGEADPQRMLLRSDLHPAELAVVICDMWDAHHCVSAARRVEEMAPHVNTVISRLRDRGALIIHAPADCVEAYRETAARQRAVHAPHRQAPVPFQWNTWISSHEAPLPPSLGDPGPCSCDSPEPCCQQGAPPPWTRQTALIEITPEDAVSDDGQEVFNLLEQRGIGHVVVMGVHTNVCVLARSYGIRQLVYLGKQPLLCRDLTDSFHRDPRGHLWGNEYMATHVERYWCPTVRSNQLVGGEPFHFRSEGSTT